MKKTFLNLFMNCAQLERSWIEIWEIQTGTEKLRAGVEKRIFSSIVALNRTGS